MEKLGGRKFVLTIISLIVGTVVEVYSKNGVSATFASLLAGLVATFGVANTVLSHKAIGAKPTEAVEASEPEPTEEPEEEETVLVKDIPRISIDLSPVYAKLDSIAEQQLKQGELLANVGLTAQNTNKLLAAALNRG